jgi:hypothetical protein
MNKRIIYSKPNGEVAVVYPVINSYPVPEPITEDQAVERAMSRLPADAINPQIVDVSAIPVDRSQRRAWRQNGASIVIDAAVVTALKDRDAIAAIDGIDRLQFEHLFDLENRTRTIEGQPTITRAQYRQALINRWKALNP